jgi:hypothetical protein
MPSEAARAFPWHHGTPRERRSRQALVPRHRPGCADPVTTPRRRRPAWPVSTSPAPAPLPLDGEWKNLGEAAFLAFVRTTAEAIIAELADSASVPSVSVSPPRGLAPAPDALDARGARPWPAAADHAGVDRASPQDAPARPRTHPGGPRAHHRPGGPDAHEAGLRRA